MADRVFVHALATVRRLPRTGSSRPPPSARLRLYGLYKQSMEGDVESILPRPTLPPLSPDPSSTTNTVHRYASRDLRAREAQAEIEKWDAWQACAGMSRTEAKRRYISTLIETMKEYASGTQESRELISDLEFVWNQIRSQSGSSEDEEGGDSPTRRLERAGLKQTQSYDSRSPGPASSGGGVISRTLSDPNRMRVLSPVSQRDSDDVVEAEEVDPAGTGADPNPNSASLNPITTIPSTAQPFTSSGQLDPQWCTRIESHLRHLSTEIAALREQLSSNHLLSSSSLSPALTSRRRRILYRASSWFRWLVWAVVRQILIDTVLLLLFILWGRWRNHKDRRVEAWVRRRWLDLRSITTAIDALIRDRFGVVTNVPGGSQIS